MLAAGVCKCMAMKERDGPLSHGAVTMLDEAFYLWSGR